MRPLAGSTLGQGGPSGAGIQLNGQGSSAQWNAALDKAEMNSTPGMLRGGGPIIGQLSGSISLGTTRGDYLVSFGAAVGSLSLDSDSNNDGLTDSPEFLANYWHYDHTTPVASGKNDFYSIALHEMIHAIGIGGSHTWNQMRSGSTWLGANAIALNGGTGVGLLEPDGSHIVSGKMSPRLFDGVLQEVAMDPSNTTGTRKYLTELDAAFLRDIGFAAVPEPSSGFLLAGVLRSSVCGADAEGGLIGRGRGPLAG
jgi:hypothetical protein